jgi:hypothetical protein
VSFLSFNIPHHTVTVLLSQLNVFLFLFVVTPFDIDPYHPVIAFVAFLLGSQGIIMISFLNVLGKGDAVMDKPGILKIGDRIGVEDGQPQILPFLAFGIAEQIKIVIADIILLLNGKLGLLDGLVSFRYGMEKDPAPDSFLPR